MAANFGAHEVMEVHETLDCAINAINQFQLLRPHVRDQQLAQMLDNQLQFMVNEYNNAVQAVHQSGMGQAAPYRAVRNAQPVYGLDHPAQQSPNMGANQIDDRDVASAMLGIHKAGATAKMIGALECANPQIRRMMQQGAVNCAEQAYEVWQYMNQNGYYQVPTMKDMTTDTVLNSYATAGTSPIAGMMQQGQPGFRQGAAYPGELPQ